MPLTLIGGLPPAARGVRRFLQEEQENSACEITSYAYEYGVERRTEKRKKNTTFALA